MGFLIVFLGGGIGAALRHGVNLASARLLGTAFPYATLFENVTGSLVMGLLAGYFAFKGDASQCWRLFLTTGILGGYTTFSAFSLDAALLYERGELGLAALYVVALGRAVDRRAVRRPRAGAPVLLITVIAPWPKDRQASSSCTEPGETCDDDDSTRGDRVWNSDIADAAGGERLLRRSRGCRAASRSPSAIAKAFRAARAWRAAPTAPRGT